jgi:hypothetical protein
MSTYVTYFETIFSTIIKNFTEAEESLSQNDREKCKDFDIEAARISIAAPISLTNLVSYLKDNDDNV